MLKYVIAFSLYTMAAAYAQQQPPTPLAERFLQNQLAQCYGDFGRLLQKLQDAQDEIVALKKEKADAKSDPVKK